MGMFFSMIPACRVRPVERWWRFTTFTPSTITCPRSGMTLDTRAFDGRGNYSFGVSEQLIFPEVDYDKVTAVRGMDITICTTSADDEGAAAFLEAFGFPFRGTTPTAV